jgi:hypothetical protein
MLYNVASALFGCWHTHYSFPRTSKPVRNSRSVPSKPRTYVVCLKCGQDLPYDWDTMRVMGKKKQAA